MPEIVPLPIFVVVTRVLRVFACVVGVVWLLGTFTATAGMNYADGVCRLPFGLWSLTWPVWIAYPSGYPAFLAWSKDLCL